jgi:tetratricopeptide (TPR) repeat protein
MNEILKNQRENRLAAETGIISNTPVHLSLEEELKVAERYILNNDPYDYDVHETIVEISLQLGNISLAKKHFNILEEKFSIKSKRVSLLKGLILECEGNISGAKEVYENILKIDECYKRARKRLIVIAKYKSHSEAVKLLVNYLDTFMNDTEAWEELYFLYMENNSPMYQEAAFCAEELLLLNSTNYGYFLLYADALFKMGGSENISLALKYYCGALDLCPDNQQALKGIKNCMSGSKYEGSFDVLVQKYLKEEK